MEKIKYSSKIFLFVPKYIDCIKDGFWSVVDRKSYNNWLRQKEIEVKL